MNNLLVPFFGGLLSVTILFIICLIVVAGIKSILLFFKPAPRKEEPIKESKQVKRKPQVKSIEIDPDAVDKIYVKKAS